MKYRRQAHYWPDGCHEAFNESAQASIAAPAKTAHDGWPRAAAAEVRLEANDDPQVPADMATDVLYAFDMGPNSGA